MAAVSVSRVEDAVQTLGENAPGLRALTLRELQPLAPRTAAAFAAALEVHTPTTLQSACSRSAV